jgi:hypothetical protein
VHGAFLHGFRMRRYAVTHDKHDATKRVPAFRADGYPENCIGLRPSRFTAPRERACHN